MQLEQICCIWSSEKWHSKTQMFNTLWLIKKAADRIPTNFQLIQHPHRKLSSSHEEPHDGDSFRNNALVFPRAIMSVEVRLLTFESPSALWKRDPHREFFFYFSTSLLGFETLSIVSCRHFMFPIQLHILFHLIPSVAFLQTAFQNASQTPTYICSWCSTCSILTDT